MITIDKKVIEKHITLAEERQDTVLRNMRDMGFRQDAIVFTRGQLEAIDQTIYDVFYANPRDAFRMVPLNTSPSAGQTQYSYRMIEDIGAAKVVGDGAQDRNMAEIELTKTTLNVVEFGSAYSYTIGNIESGGLLDFSIVQEKARVAAEMIALAHNEYCLLGGSGVDGGYASVLGFLNQTAVNIGSESGADYVIKDSNWATVPSGVDQYETVTDMIHEVFTQSSGLHRASNVELSTYIWNAVSKTLLNANSSQTVLSALRQNYPEISFNVSPSLTARGAGGIDRNVAYERLSSRVEYVASVLYDTASPDKSGFAFTTQARGKSFGVAFRYPLSAVYGDITIA
jgi:hypothetical protein